MMPFCEYRKCKRVADKEIRLLRMWSSYDFRKSPNHTQAIWLCAKHHKKISKALNVDELDADKEK